MATLTRNLFWGQGERDHRLEVIEGAWPTDVAGSVYVIGPDKRAPGGHWFGAHGLIERIRMAPGGDGRIEVTHRRVDTRVNRLRRRLPFLFKTMGFVEVSPFGFTNMANTNLQPLGDRLFVGFDAGRPLEVDPETLDHLTPVGSNGEWLQAAPGLIEPLCAVAAHPAPDVAEAAMYFVNYVQITPPGEVADTWVARWDLEGPVQRWKVEGMSAFDSIHDIKATEHHLVFTDLPFVFEPGAFTGEPRQQRIQDDTKVWIVAKEDLRSTPPGGTVRATEVRIPVPTGHLFVDHAEVDGMVRVVLQHAPLTDLMIWMDRDTVDHRTGALVDPAYAGMVATAVQPAMFGRHLIDPVTGVVKESDVAVDVERAWGGILATTDTFSPEARADVRNLWFVNTGYDPELVPQPWWDLYAEATDGVVDPADLPDQVVPGSLAHLDVEAMEIDVVWSYDGGAFPSPPTFVPRADATGPDDGYVVVVVHQDGPKEVQVFDAADIGGGPIARATSPTFNPNLMLHSHWMDDRVGPRPSSYRVSLGEDLRGVLTGLGDIGRAAGGMVRYARSAARR